MALFNIDKLKYFTNTVLPTIFDDALSYQEVLGKVVHRLNEIVDLANEQTEQITEWNTETNTTIQEWETNFRVEISAWETRIENDLSTWKDNAESDIDDWMNETLDALDEWKDSFETEYAALKAEVEQIADDAETAKNAAAASATAAASSATSAASSATAISESAQQIEDNKNNITGINDVIYNTETKTFTQGKYCKTDGTIGTNSSWQTIKLKIADAFYNNKMYGNSRTNSYSDTYPSIVFQDINNNVTGYIFDQLYINDITENIVPQNSYYINLNAMITTTERNVYVYSVIDKINNAVNYLNSETGKTVINLSEVSTAIYVEYPLIEGKWYKFTNNMANTTAIRTSDSAGGEVIDVIASQILANKSVIYRALNNSQYLKIVVNSAGSITVEKIDDNIASAKIYSELTPFYKLKYIYDAKALGGNTDDDIAISNYISNENYIYLPAANYVFYNPVEITKRGVIIEGEGANWRTNIKPYDDNVNALFVVHRASTNVSTYFTIKNCTFELVNQSDGLSNAGTCISTDDGINGVMVDSRIENCWFNGGNAQTALNGSAINGQFAETMIRGCYFEMFDTAIITKNYSSSSTTNSVIISDCSFWNNTHNLLIQGTVNINNCIFTPVKGGYTVKANGQTNISFRNCYISNNAAYDIDDTIYKNINGNIFEITTNTDNLLVENCTLRDAQSENTYYDNIITGNNGFATIRNINAGRYIYINPEVNNYSVCYFSPLELISTVNTITNANITINNIINECYMRITTEQDTTLTITFNSDSSNALTLPIKTGKTLCVKQYSGSATIVSSSGNITVKYYTA